MKLPVEDISFTLLSDYLVLDEELQKIDYDGPGPFEPDAGIAHAKASQKRCIEDRDRDRLEGYFQRTAVQFLRHYLIVKNCFLILRLEVEPFNNLRQPFIIDLESKGRKVPVADQRCMNLADL